MKTLKRALFLMLAVVMVASCFAACTGKPSADYTWDGTPQYGGHLNVRNTARPTGLDPMNQTGAWRYHYMTMVYEPFLSRDPKNNIQPCVCDYVLQDYREEPTEARPEGQLHNELWIWPREGYTFSGGSGQVDMNDIVASWNRGLAQYANIRYYVKPNVVAAEVLKVADLPEDIQAQIKAKDPSVEEIFHIDFKYHEKNLYYFAAWRTWWPVMPAEICEKYATTYNMNVLEDAVGTGPYYFYEFKDSTYVTVKKRSDYTPVIQDESQTGMSATKYGYLDSATYWYNTTDASAASAVLSGQYDCTEVIPSEYAGQAAASGLALTKMHSDQRTWIKFNTMGTNNLVAKYPSLRKAVMAAIDYPTFLAYITDDSQILEGDNIMLSDLYDVTYKFKEADYYGEYKPEVVEKYMAMAREEGYKGEPLQVPHHTGRTDIPTMIAANMERAGINYKLVANESAAYAAMIGDPSQNWDFYFEWAVTFHTPGTMSDALVKDNFKSDRIVEIREQLMPYLAPDSEEYLALWDEWTDIWVDECQMGYLSAIEWWWWHPESLVINDGGDDPNVLCEQRNFFNTYWKDPQNHPMQ